MVESLAHRTFTLIKMLVVLVVFTAVVVFSTIAFAAQDWLWFMSGFEPLPYKIVIHDAGQQTELRAGDPDYAVLAEAIRSSLAQGVARQTGVGMSGDSLKEAYNRYLTVEAFFSHSVKLHAGFETGAPTQMLFPITGRHSEMNTVFLGTADGYRVNAPALKTTQPIRDVLMALGFAFDQK